MSLFDKIKIKRPRMSKFDLSHEKKLSMNMGELVPILLEEVVPGDSFRCSSEVFIRFSPLLSPMMHRVTSTVHYFFVPNRLVWENWQEFITGGEDGQSAPEFPYMSIQVNTGQYFQLGGLADYLGIPPAYTTTPAQTVNISALPFRAYQLIYNEYYRDQNLTPEVVIPKTDGITSAADIATLTTLQNRAWEKDYFTSALPWAQRGGDVVLPVTTPFDPTYSNTSQFFQAGGTTPIGGDVIGEAGTGELQVGGTNPARLENLEPNQILEGTSVSVNELRRAYRLQEWLEKNARAGARYIEQILSHFGVRSSDARLQRPEYLGGGKQNVVISEVLNTTGIQSGTEPEADGNVQGYMAGHGVSMGKSNRFTRKFEEHGYIIGLMSILPKTAYQQGIHRTWTKFDKFDYAWPEFANLGEQEVKQKELMVNYDLDDTYNEQTFGYQSRYSEYKYGCSTVHGDFRGSDPTSEVSLLNYWHMGRIFDPASPPALNTAFVTSDPTQRVFAVTDDAEDKMYVQIYNSISAIRPLPYFGTPVT